MQSSQTPSFSEGLFARLKVYMQNTPSQCPRCSYKLDQHPEKFCMYCSASPSWNYGELQQPILLQMDPIDDDLLSQIDAMSSPAIQSLTSTPESSMPASQRNSYFDAQ
ncbi:hypothetical protein DSO57_1037955 [Entomophthora muscae]|uniref:Uncharacterized protein n=1 Tax=Entomophthora muscae TaxID=34485 RepID=A0ACC2SMU7_9FUNG|nr:hypothetical protein DSO57_1037955 [Entomophthora muscae]